MISLYLQEQGGGYRDPAKSTSDDEVEQPMLGERRESHVVDLEEDGASSAADHTTAATVVSFSDGTFNLVLSTLGLGGQ